MQLRSKRVVALAALAIAGLGVSCVQHEADPLAGTTSMAVTITSPTNLGTQASRLPDSTKTVSISVQAIDDQGNLDTSFNYAVDVYVQYLGTIDPPAQTLQLTNGVGSMVVSVPEAFGSTYLWVEDSTDDGGGTRNPSYATGTSPILWFRDPVIEDTQIPDMTNTATWLSDDQLEGKQVTINTSKHGANGKIVVTGVFVDGCSISDVDCTTKPCVADPFNHAFIYSFSAPIDTSGRLAEIGDVVDSVGGGNGEFDGYTELNFPVFTLNDADPDESLVPDPVVVQEAWLEMPTQPTGEINMEKLESGLIEIDNATVCPLDADYTGYYEWKVDIGLGCRYPIDVVTNGQVPSFDPTTVVGMKMTKIVGALKAINIGSFNVWIVLPRRASDLVQ